MSLTLEQAAELSRVGKSAIFFEHEKTTVDTYVPFKDEVANFMNNYDELKSVLHLKDVVTTGITKNKTELKHEVADNAAVICRKTRAFALKFNLDELAAQTNYYADKIFAKKDGDILPFVHRWWRPLLLTW